MRVRNCFVWLLLFVVSSLSANAWRFDTRHSTLKVTDNGTFTINNPIVDWDGTLIRSTNGSITGEQISFVDGLLEDAGNQILLHGIFDPAGTILLQGNDTFNAQPGYILQQVRVSGDANCLFGQPIFASSLSLADASTTLTLGIQSQMNQNIELNNGTLVFKNDLIFTDNAIITGDGEVHGNGYTVETGGVPFTWTSSINWFTNINLKTCVDFTGSFTFSAPQNKIEGNGFVYDLTGGGVLTVASGSTLTLSNVVIKGLGDGAGFGKIILTDSTSKLVLTNVTLLFSDDFTTSEGVVEVKGPTTAVVKNHDWLFDMSSTLTVDCLTLWKDTAGAQPCGDILFESSSNLGLINDGIIDYITLRCTSIVEAIDSALEVNDSRIDVLESEIDELGSDDSRLDLLESCCEVNDSRIDVLESEIEEIGFSLPDDLDSRLELLESCCDVNGSSIDVLQSEIDAISVSLPDGLISRIELLESCCEVNDSRIDVLESEIDNISTGTCVITVCGDLNFELSMLPGPGEAVVFEFCKCYESKLNPPSVIFDPAILGGGGTVELPKGSRLAFCGFGTVDLKDGVTFEFTGTACADMGIQPDWPELLLDECACMVVEEGATAMITGGDDGAGCLNMRKGGCILLDQPNSHLIFGENCKNEIIIHASLGSHITVDNPTALISFQLGVFDLIFDNNSSLQVSDGTIEMNTLNCVESPGVIRKWEFLNDSCLVLPGQCGKTFGLLRLAPNDPNHCCVTSGSENVMFNNLEGHVCGRGDLQYVSFDGGGAKVVNSTSQIQDNRFCITAPMVEVFMELSYLLEPGLVPPPDATILALQGTRPDQSKCGRLVAFCPARDGSFVGLSQGDHDIFYDSSESCGTLDLVRGYDRLGQVFTVSDCDESTRTPPAPPLT